SVFRALSQNFKIDVIPNLLAHGKSYGHCFVKKYNSHKLYATSRFDRFFGHHLRISKYWPFTTY
ncbi:hypothetical protein B296_00016589, partial [Ensete ventricosum]